MCYSNRNTLRVKGGPNNNFHLPQGQNETTSGHLQHGVSLFRCMWISSSVDKFHFLKIQISGCVPYVQVMQKKSTYPIQLIQLPISYIFKFLFLHVLSFMTQEHLLIIFDRGGNREYAASSRPLLLRQEK